jgi:YfiR/HmsC-like
MTHRPNRAIPVGTSAGGGRAARWLRATGVVLCAALLAWIASAPSWHARAAEDPESLEVRVKAAFLYKFAGYVEWPPKSFARPETPVTIGVIGAESLATELTEAVTGRTVNDRPVTVRRLKPGESLAGIHVLFVGRAESARLDQLAQSAQPRSILTVSESDCALARGSVINFVLTGGRVRFEIALDSAEKSGLRLSSRLLAVAQQVTGTP